MWDPPTEPATPSSYNFDHDTLEYHQSSFQYMDICDGLWGEFEVIDDTIWDNDKWVQIAFVWMPPEDIKWIAFEIQVIGENTTCKVSTTGPYGSEASNELESFTSGTAHTYVLPIADLSSNIFILTFSQCGIGDLIRINFMGVYDTWYAPTYPYAM